MSVNLLKYAETDGTLFLLDDQPMTVESERDAAEAMQLKWDHTDRPRKFIDKVLQWKDHWDHKLDTEERSETKAALLIDNRLRPPPDIEALICERKELEEAKKTLPRHRQLLNTDDGSRFGLTFIQYIIRGVSELRELPVILLSAYGISRYENLLGKINKQFEAPTIYIPKVASKKKSSDVADFERAIGKVIYDRRLYIMHRLAYDIWDFSEGEVCSALAVRSGNVKDVGKLFDRRQPRLTSNTDQRVDCLRIIHERLSRLFDGRQDVELEWLSTPAPELGSTAPLELICSGDFQKLSLVQGFVETQCDPWGEENADTAIEVFGHEVKGERHE